MLNNLISLAKGARTNTKDKSVQKSVQTPTPTAFMTFKFCNELEILLSNTTSKFGFQLASTICSQNLHADI